MSTTTIHPTILTPETAGTIWQLGAQAGWDAGVRAKGNLPKRSTEGDGQVIDISGLFAAADEADDVLRALSGDPSRRSREGDQLRVHVADAQCPIRWCETHDGDDDGFLHVGGTSPLGVQISALEQDGEIAPAKIYVPTLEREDVTAEDAAAFAAELLNAVATISAMDAEAER
ncbi:hypothetical protein [Nakamurella lactea]|uniref:hypothetical protein n=1 Tax=Nakamurella lactea TaxID=459515 RepID=UPI0004114265|nr:hypothetical protein [Nakamurella lactea]